MQRHLYRAASWVLVVAMLASSFAVLLGTAAATSSTTYALTGYVDQPSGPLAPPVPAGVTVDLISRATGAVYTTTVTGTGGQFTFTASGTSGALAPGYWGLYVPPASNVSLTGCKRCAVLPQAQDPTYQYYSAAVLTNSTNHSQILTNVSILPYVTLLSGTVKLGGSALAGVTVRLLAPTYAGFVFASNTTNASGGYNLTVPQGQWLLQATYAQGSQLYTNSTSETISGAKQTATALNLQPLSISGRIYSVVTKTYVSAAGNATLYDPTNAYVYSTSTPPGGYYSFPSYNFTSGKKQPFTIGVDPIGYQPSWVNVTVSSPLTPITKQVNVTPLTPGDLGYFNTTLNFGGFLPTSGKGTLRVDTNVTLHNDTVLSALPNASVGQLWAQLGLDFAHSLYLPATDVSSNTSAVGSWIQAQGPFFPAVQASTTINGTGFYQPSPPSPQPLKTFSSTCKSGSCGLLSSAALAYNWTTNYTLNGTAPKNASTYVLSFGFAHPATSSQLYNYKVVLPAHYALYANTTAPAQTTLLGNGAESTWTTFTLQSKQSSTSSATASFTIVREKNLTANVEITSANSTFTSGNVLNSTHYNYTVVLGVHENATFSAAKSVYPVGQNGTRFVWNFGDKSTVKGDLGTNNTTNVTTNHTYLAVGTYDGTLEIIGSSGRTNNTTFNVSVVNTVPTAGIASNATAKETKTIANTAFLLVNWTTTLHFNSTATKFVPASAANKLSIATYTLKARNYTSTANFSIAKGASPKANWTVAFGANTTNSVTAPGHGVYVNFTTVKINDTATGINGWGWIYNLTLEVWSLVGTNSTTHLTILVADTEPPVPKITLDTANGTAITNGSVVEGPNHYAVVKLNATGSTDYGNGSVVGYTWTITNTNKSFTNLTWKNSTIKPLPTLRLAPRTSDYKINLTVADKAGNKGNASVSLEVAENTSLRPVMEANNLTGPSSVNAGTSYTYWVNITVGGGSKSVAHNISVSFYLLSSSGSGSKSYIGGSPGSVLFYGYSNTSKSATVNSTSISTGLIQDLKYNKTVRAVLHWTPSSSGSFILYANVTATNQFVNGSSASVASTPITVHTNPTTQDLEYGGIAAAVIVVLVVLVLLFRRRNRKPGAAKPSSSKSGIERGGKHADDEDDDDT